MHIRIGNKMGMEHQSFSGGFGLQDSHFKFQSDAIQISIDHCKNFFGLAICLCSKNMHNFWIAKSVG